MPTYVYACKNCGHRFEQYQSFSDDSLTTCPECTQDALRKVFDSVGIVFKGSGFYSTDSAKSDSTSVASGAASASGESASSTSSSSDSSSSDSSSPTGASSGDSSASSTSAPQPAAASAS